MNNPIKLKDLVAELQKLVDQGHGEAVVSCEEYVIQSSPIVKADAEVELYGRA